MLGLGAWSRSGGVTVVVVVLAVATTACGKAAHPTSDPATASAEASFSIEYSPGQTEDVYLPATKGPAPLVVMVPGGSWVTADPAGFAGLAAHLAAAGVVAAPTTIQAAVDDVVYPVPVEDVLCAVAVAVDQVRARGYRPGPVTVLGHSSGAQLAALAALAADDYTPTCDSPPVAPDALVGLSGPYDISRVPDIAQELLGSSPDDDPETWQAANPVDQAALRPDLPALLLHGEDDDTVPVDFTTQFAQALEDGGHPTTTEIVPGADHDSIYRADVSGDLIAEWLLALPT
ncbi:hypothetical protein ASC77_11810 [Nocardioides sp. Root1257]|uniref:alpha/beta hydrolase family protein n=1 Tax=unclassified Nocardioides TaxID=2615069 RepID=UPI0006FDFDEB|nr:MULTISPECIES: alpha/beta fold hydrolase [unclassified Nocardioides]KQW49354.1 hypothetical protein ASC77_11810 [Nocardioides sp. Root1257]KRC48528.1 hypothetical protein ASE24_11815 [Nocardioides sp. Root224]